MGIESPCPPFFPFPLTRLSRRFCPRLLSPKSKSNRSISSCSKVKCKKKKKIYFNLIIRDRMKWAMKIIFMLVVKITGMWALNKILGCKYFNPTSFHQVWILTWSLMTGCDGAKPTRQTLFEWTRTIWSPLMKVSLLPSEIIINKYFETIGHNIFQRTIDSSN